MMPGETAEELDWAFLFWVASSAVAVAADAAVTSLGTRAIPSPADVLVVEADVVEGRSLEELVDGAVDVELDRLVDETVIETTT